MPLPNAAKHVALDALCKGTAPSTSISHVSLHNGDPGGTGANEISGGAPAYARLAVTFNAAASGESAIPADLTFDVPATTVMHVGYWSAVTAGTFLGSDPVTNEVFAAQGQYKVLAGSKINLTDV